MVFTTMLQDITMKDSLKMGNSMAKELTTTQTEKNMRVVSNGKKSMEKGLIISLLEINL